MSPEHRLLPLAVTARPRPDHPSRTQVSTGCTCGLWTVRLTRRNLTAARAAVRAQHHDHTRSPA